MSDKGHSTQFVLDQLRLVAYTQAAGRLRWFLFATVMVSALMLAHVILEQYSYDKCQLEHSYALRVSQHRDQLRTLLDQAAARGDVADSILAEANRLVPDAKFGSLDDLSRTYFRIVKGDNTMRTLHREPRTLFLLGLNVPGNDYVPVCVVILLILYTGVFFNIRTVSESGRSIQDGAIKSIRCFHLGYLGRPVASVPIALVPLLALLTSSFLDLKPVLFGSTNAPLGYLGPREMIIYRAVLYALAAIYLLFLSGVVVHSLFGIRTREVPTQD